MEVMTARHDILDRPESLKNPFFGSLALHGSVLAAAIVFSWLPAVQVLPWGDENALGGGSVSITPVRSIPMPARAGQVNPVANDTESQVPAPPPQATAPAKPKPAPVAVAEAKPIPQRQAQPREEAAPTSRRRSRQAPSPDAPNQLYSESGSALVSPMLNTTSGGGSVGVGQGGQLGSRFGAYVSILQQRVRETWDTSQIDPRLQTAPMVIVVFDLQRDGSVRNVRFLQASGHPTLDNSARRAIIDASPFPPLPDGFERSSARVEFSFELKR